ncbi:hypothetical protein EJ03DRAFT_352833 [Teratosphaeria nubilosa]|uniref:Uncharacterized protein n=1 Tax=Teratosphaeria nubilosa TaxID=161662 RepID=A0A6G1L4D1_9PEZI|nr:hypothetical protein EJ03DRAFT_352833 [Teratosphaeria nubilosa]
MTAFNNLASYKTDTFVDEAIDFVRTTLLYYGILTCGLVLYIAVLAALWAYLHVLLEDLVDEGEEDVVTDACGIRGFAEGEGYCWADDLLSLAPRKRKAHIPQSLTLNGDFILYPTTPLFASIRNFSAKWHPNTAPRPRLYSANVPPSLLA